MNSLQVFDYDLASPEMIKGRKNKLEGLAGSPLPSDAPSLYFNVSLEDIMKEQNVLSMSF
jgi:hypothetical protein